MGQGYSYAPLFKVCSGSKPINLLFVGLDNSGKTTLIEQFVKDSTSWFSSESCPSTKRGQVHAEQRTDVMVIEAGKDRDTEMERRVIKVKVTPTIGFTVTRFSLGQQCVTVFDMSGQVSGQWSTIE